MIAFDTETYPFTPGLAAPPPVCVSFASASKNALQLRREGLDTLHKVLLGKLGIIGANVAFDFAVACAWDPHLLPLVFQAYADDRITDVQIREMLINIAIGERSFRWNPETGKNEKVDYKLDTLSQRYLNRALDKGEDGWRKRYGLLDGVPLEEWPERARAYAQDDARTTFDVYLAQCGTHRLPDGKVIDEYPQARAAFAFTLMRCWGVRTDPERVAAIKADLEARRAKAQQELHAKGFLRVENAQKGKPHHFIGEDGKRKKYVKNMDLIRARVKACYEALGEDVPFTDPSEKFPSGQIATDRDTLEQTGDPDLEFLADAGPVNTALNTFVPALEHGTVYPINADWRVLVDSGRSSCSKPNWQNVPWKIPGLRECVVARPGFVLSSVDYDTLELRTLAQTLFELFGRSALRDLLLAGVDPHTKLAASMLGKTYEQLAADRKTKCACPAPPPGEDKSGECPKCVADWFRNLAKAPNFGFPGGMGAKKLPIFARQSYGIEIPLDSADPLKPGAVQLRASWLAEFPEMGDFFKHVSALVGRGGEAPIRSPVSGRVSVCGFCDGCNRYFQGRAADGAKAALFEVSRECYTGKKPDGSPSPLAGSRPIFFIHDEILCEHPEELAHEGAHRVAEIMRAVMALYCPDVPITASPALMRRWSKKAEAVYDSNKRLIPWEPKEAKAA